MADGAGVTLLNAERLIRKLKELPDKLAKKLTRSSLRVAGNILLKATKERAPVLSGALKKSLKLRAPRRSRKNKDKIRLRIVTSAIDNLFAGDTYYGAFYEFGTKHQPPRPFMKQAANDSRQGVIAAFRADLSGKIAALASGSP
jgi:HK97 gp10 family phage protein